MEDVGEQRTGVTRMQGISEVLKLFGIEVTATSMVLVVKKHDESFVRTGVTYPCFVYPRGTDNIASDLSQESVQMKRIG